MQALRKKVPAKEFLRGFSADSNRSFERSKPESVPITRRNLTDSDISKLRELSSEIKGKNVLVINENLEVVKNVPSSKLEYLNPTDAFIIAVSNATTQIIRDAERLGSKAVAAKTFGKVDNVSVELISI